MPDNIYISSLAFKGMDAETMIAVARENDWALEFSSGMTYRDDMEKLYMNSDIKRLPHNYFPVPRIPFVLNLASADDKIRSKSIDHCKNGLKLAKYSAAPFFSAHAGFCIDPKPQELGKRIAVTEHYNKETHKKIFIESIIEILDTADDLSMDFLIENNVIAGFNYVNGNNPLLCCESSEIRWLYESITHTRFGLLLDTAHLKVSCNTLGKNIDHELGLIQLYIRAIHHSDNDGKKDDNLALSKEYWFLKNIKFFNQLPQVLEVKDLSVSEIKQQLKILQNIWN